MKKVLVGGLVVALILAVFTLTFTVTVYAVAHDQTAAQVDGLNYGERFVSVAQNYILPLAFGGWLAPLQAPFRYFPPPPPPK